MEKQEYVVGFAFDETRTSVALIRKNRPVWQYGLLNGIGGKIEPGEHPDDAMRREFREEAGVDCAWEKFLEASGEQYKLYCYRAVVPGLGDKITSLTDEQVSMIYVPAIRDSGCIPNLFWMVPMAADFDVEQAVVFQK